MEKGTSNSSSTKSPSEPLQQEQAAECLNDEDVGVRSDVTESSNPQYVDLLERGDSSYLFEQDQSDESLVEEDMLEKMFVTPVSGYMLPKIECGDYPEQEVVNSSYLEFLSHGEDEDEDQPFGLWSY
ncbi:unnamed protein product [Lactuca saligna]|uniref:Uncharacterized protein n=1 Tax=Lactuca saligna TaxID=75948 RepID=A0AA36EI88_LACSI|nr:unnamed protein product [Lactuca saligna]